MVTNDGVLMMVYYPAHLYEEIGKSVLQGFSQGVHRIEANPRQVWVWKLETSDVMMCFVKKRTWAEYISYIHLYPMALYGIPIIWYNVITNITVKYIVVSHGLEKNHTSSQNITVVSHSIPHITVVSHGIPSHFHGPSHPLASRRVVSTREWPPLHRSTVAVPDPAWGWTHPGWPGHGSKQSVGNLSICHMQIYTLYIYIYICLLYTL